MPFASDQFFGVFRAYNESVWPAQWLLLAAGIVIGTGAVAGRGGWPRLSFFLLGCLWLWMALVYHLAFFARINPAAPAFAVMFITAAALFMCRALRRSAPCLEVRIRLRGIIGVALVVYALLLYPLIGLLSGQLYPSAPTFGLPCPTTIFTIGILSFVQPNPDRYLLVVPISWTIIGTTGAFTFGVPQDYFLALAGLWAVSLAFNLQPTSASRKSCRATQ